MSTFRRLGLLLCLLFIATSCTKKSQHTVILKVGDRTWTLRTYKERLRLKLKSIRPVERKTITDLKMLKQNLTRDLIFTSLIEIWARDSKIKIPPIPMDPEEQKLFSAQDISQKDLKTYKKARLLHQVLLKELAKQVRKPRLSRQKSYYSKNKRRFRRPAACYLKQILVSSKNLAEELVLKIKREDSFDKLHLLHSNNQDAIWVEKGGLEIFNKACSLKVNQISPVLKSSYGYHIFKILKKRKAQQRKFSKVQKEIIEILTKNPRKKQLQAWMKDMISKTSVEINEKALDKIHIQYKR